VDFKASQTNSGEENGDDSQTSHFKSLHNPVHSALLQL